MDEKGYFPFPLTWDGIEKGKVVLGPYVLSKMECLAALSTPHYLPEDGELHKQQVVVLAVRQLTLLSIRVDVSSNH